MYEVRTTGSTVWNASVNTGGGYLAIDTEFIDKNNLTYLAVQYDGTTVVFDQDGITRKTLSTVFPDHSDTGILEIANWSGNVFPMELHQMLFFKPLKAKVLTHLSTYGG